jgi:hypothetical protein
MEGIGVVERRSGAPRFTELSPRSVAEHFRGRSPGTRFEDGPCLDNRTTRPVFDALIDLEIAV